MINIAVLVRDEEYAAGLEKYLSAGASGNISFGVYTQHDGFECYVREQEPSAVVLEEGFTVENQRIPCLRLVRKKSGEEDESIEMYRSLESVAKDIINEVVALPVHKSGSEEGDASKPETNDSDMSGIDQCYAHMKGIADESVGRVRVRGSTQIVCVCSPFGGTYSSTFAYALASYHSKGVRTLFVSFDPFFDATFGDEITVKGGLGKLIYYLDSGSESAVQRSVQRTGGLDCIFGADHWTDICDMRKEHAIKLTDLIHTEGYKSVIFDIKLFGAASIPLLRSAGKIWVPCPPGAHREKRRISEWKRQLQQIGIEEEKVSYIEVPFDELLHKGCEYAVLLKGRLGRFIEETEGRRYVR